MKSLFSLFKNRQPAQGDIIHPWDMPEMTKLSRKLGVSPRQLNEAVIDTGSLYLKDIKHYLRSKRISLSLWSLLW